MSDRAFVDVTYDSGLAHQMVKEFLDRLPEYRFGHLINDGTGERYAMVAVSVTEMIDLMKEGMIIALVTDKLGTIE